MPFFGNLGIEGGEVVKTGQHFLSGAVRTAAAALGAAGDDGLVVMAFVAEPPNFAVAGGGDVVGGQCAVFGGVPRFGNLRVKGGEVVFPGDDFFTGTDGTTAAVCAAGDGGLIGMSMLTKPPDFAAAAGRNVLWSEGAIFGGVPLFCQVVIEGGEVVFAGLHFFVAANGAAGAAYAAFYLGAPFMPLLAAPPDETMAAGKKGAGLEVAVFGGVPFFDQRWVEGGEVCLTGDRQMFVAIRTAGACAGACVHGGLPMMAVGAGPPNAAFAAAADGVWRQRQIARAVPLGKKIFALQAMAIF